MSTPKDRIPPPPITPIQRDVTNIDPLFDREEDEDPPIFRRLFRNVMEQFLPTELRNFVAREVLGMPYYGLSPEETQQRIRRSLELEVPYPELEGVSKLESLLPENVRKAEELRQQEIDRRMAAAEGPGLLRPRQQNLLQRYIPPDIYRQITDIPLVRDVATLLYDPEGGPLSLVEGHGLAHGFISTTKKISNAATKFDEIVTDFINGHLNQIAAKVELEGILDEPVSDHMLQSLQHLYKGTGLTLGDIQKRLGSDWSIEAFGGSFKTELPDGQSVLLFNLPSGELAAGIPFKEMKHFDNIDEAFNYLDNLIASKTSNIAIEELPEGVTKVKDNVWKYGDNEIIYEPNDKLYYVLAPNGHIAADYQTLDEAVGFIETTKTNKGLGYNLSVPQLVSGTGLTEWHQGSVNFGFGYSLLGRLDNGNFVTVVPSDNGYKVFAHGMNNVQEVKTPNEVYDIIKQVNKGTPTPSPAPTPKNFKTSGKTYGEYKEEQILDALFGEPKGELNLGESVPYQGKTIQPYTLQQALNETGTKWEVINLSDGSVMYGTTLPDGNNVSIVTDPNGAGNFYVGTSKAEPVTLNTPDEISEYLFNLTGKRVSSAAPLPKATTGQFTLDDLTFDVFMNNKVGGQEGSNKGGWYEITEGPLAGTRIYGKLPNGGDTQARTENLANRIYNKYGSKRAPRTTIVETPDGLMHVSQSLGEGWKTASNINDITPEQAKLILEDFYLDVILANWDVVSYNFDNILLSSNGIDIIKVDQGGSLLYRAAQGRKPDRILNTIAEDWDKFPTTVGYGAVMRRAGYETFDEYIVDNYDAVLSKVVNLPDDWSAYVHRIYPDWNTTDKRRIVEMLNSRTAEFKKRMSNIAPSYIQKKIDDAIAAGRQIDKSWPLWQQMLRMEGSKLDDIRYFRNIAQLDPDFNILLNALESWTSSSQELRGSINKLLGLFGTRYQMIKPGGEEAARMLLDAINREQPNATELFRGIRAGGMAKYGNLQPGDVVEQIPASFSANFDVARSFAGDQYPVIFQLERGSKSLRITKLSSHPEAEWISGGRMLVTEVEDIPYQGKTIRMITIKQEATYNAPVK